MAYVVPELAYRSRTATVSDFQQARAAASTIVAFTNSESYSASLNSQPNHNYGMHLTARRSDIERVPYISGTYEPRRLPGVGICLCMREYAP